MTHQTITVSEDGGIGTIALNRPQVMNALSRQMRLDLTQA